MDSAAQLVSRATARPSSDRTRKADFWDPERDTNLRPSRYFDRPDAVRDAVQALIGAYKKLVVEENQQLAPSEIIRTIEEWRSDLVALAGKIDNLNLSAARAIAQIRTTRDKEIVKSILPLQPGLFGRSQLSISLRTQANAFQNLAASMRMGPPGTVWSQTKVGRGNTVLRWLGGAPSRLQLVHMCWRVYEEFGCQMPPATKEFAQFISYIYELATGEPDRYLGIRLGKYFGLQKRFAALGKVLRAESNKLYLEDFYQLEFYVTRFWQKAPNSNSARFKKLADNIRLYKELRSQLLGVPYISPKQ